MAETTNTASSIKPLLKEAYSDGKKKKKKKDDKFEKIKSMCKRSK